MKINAAALALMATSAAAAPLVAVDTATSRVTTAAGTTTAPSTTTRRAFDPMPTGVFEVCVMPDGCRDNSKDDDDEPKFSLPWFPGSSSQVSTATGTTAVPSKTDHPVIDPTETIKVEPCVMPWGCRDNSKDDDPMLPPWGPIPTRPTPEVRTYTVPTETASVSHDSILPVAEPTSA